MSAQCWRDDSGSASIEFVGLIPALLLVALIALQFLTAGFTLWSAATAARAGARAAHIGADADRAARRALPELMRGGTRVRTARGSVTAQVPVPRLLPFLPRVEVEAKSALEATR